MNIKRTGDTPFSLTRTIGPWLFCESLADHVMDRMYTILSGIESHGIADESSGARCSGSKSGSTLEGGIWNIPDSAGRSCFAANDPDAGRSVARESF